MLSFFHNNNLKRSTKRIKNPFKNQNLKSIFLDYKQINILENETIPFESAHEFMEIFDKLEQSNLGLIQKNQTNQDKCLAIAKDIKDTRRQKQVKLAKLKIKKALLTKTIKSNFYKENQELLIIGSIIKTSKAQTLNS